MQKTKPPVDRQIAATGLLRSKILGTGGIWDWQNSWKCVYLHPAKFLEMSQFLSDSSDYNAERVADIDFASAVRLPQEGSASEVYKTRWHRRTVLVKRLKEEFRDSPLHLDALEKEYEIGVTLSHPSLPTYLAFDRDYIVMEYVDGDTLASMLKKDDPWLSGMWRQVLF